MAGDAEQESKEERAAGVERMLEGEPPPVEPPRNDPEPPEEAPGASSVGDSVTRRGEEIVDRDGKEPGRIDTGSDGTPADRPTGVSTERDLTGVDPDES